MSLINYFEAYANKVFHFDSILGSLSDERIEPTIPLHSIVKAVFLAAAFRIKAISSIELECRLGILKKKIGPMSDDTIGYGLKHLSPDQLRLEMRQLQKVWKRNGMLRNNPFHDWIVGVLDVIEIGSSYERHCPKCLVRQR